MKCYSILHFLTFVLYYTSIFVASTDGNEDIPNEIKELSKESQNIYLELKTENRWNPYMIELCKNTSLLKEFFAHEKFHRKKVEVERKKFDLALKHGAFPGLLCAMNFYNFRFNHAMNRFGVSFVDVTKTKFPTKVEWPERIMDIRAKNDHCWEYNGEREAIYWTTKGNGNKRGLGPKLRPEWEASDNKTFFRWVAFLTCDPKKIKFKREDGVTLNFGKVLDYRKNAENVQKFLKKYYDSLSADEQNVYSNVTYFSVFFAAIQVRNYRFSCYFEHELQTKILIIFAEVDANGNEHNLLQIIKHLEPNWYFDDEILRLSGILLQLIAGDRESFYIGGNFTNALNQSVIIPALDGCPLSNPSEQWIANKRAQMEKKVLNSSFPLA